MLAVEEAHRRIVGGLAVLPSEWVHLGAADCRVLARDLVATRDQPPGDSSAMDGYAVRAADLESGGAELRLVGAAPAGASYDGPLAPSETVRIFTGGLLPEGADAVALQENAEADGDRIRLDGRVEPGTHVRPAGLDFARGACVLPAGTVLAARNLGLAAALNHAWLPVRRRPRIGILATGDELVRPGAATTPTQIPNSNTVTLAAMVRAWGGEPFDLGIAVDEPDALAGLVAELKQVDLVITIGGASVGDRDLVRGVLGDHGLVLDFWQIAMRPGKPLLFGDLHGVPLIGVPGNPVSAGVCALLFIRPAIQALLGLDPSHIEIPAVLGQPLPANDHRQEYRRARAEWLADGRLQATPADRQDSSMLAVFARASCLIKRTPLAPPAAAGTPITALPLDGDLFQV